MAKKIVYGGESRTSLIAGVNAVADAVRVTLGPKGKNVIIDREYGDPQIINDGVSIAKEIELEDPVENAGAKLIIAAASKANDESGDGSSTTIILTQAMIQEGIKNLSEGRNAVSLKNGMKRAAEAVARELDKKAIPVDTSASIAQVATISAGNDEEVGKLIEEAMERVGKDGVITVSDSKTFETTLEVTEGMQFDRGYINPYFATDAEKGEAVYENPYVLCANKKIGSVKEILPILQQVAEEGSALLIIAEDVEGEALATMTVNKMRNLIKVVAVKAPDYGTYRKDNLEDIAILTGGNCAIDELGQKLENFTLQDLGHADKIIVTKDHTTIITSETNERLQERIKVLSAKIEVTENEYDKNKLKERLAKLSGGVAVIKVGATTETEMHEKKLRIEDALNATKAAVKEGIVAGGGVALLEVYNNFISSDHQAEVDSDAEVGRHIVIEALKAPVKQIAENAGKTGEVIIADIQRANKDGYGYDALHDCYTNVIEDGIIDPVKVTKNALLNATSIASMLLTAEAAIVKKPEKQQPAIPPIM
jgi:chaperonin GroEL